MATLRRAMRIALTHAECWPESRRGAERFIPELGAALVRRGHDVVHFSSAWKPGESVERGVRTIRLRRRFERPYRHEADFAARLLPRLARSRLDAVHSLGHFDALASALAARLRRDSRRTVITDLGLPDREYWARRGPIHSRVAAAVVAWIDVYSGMSQLAVEYLACNYGRRDGVVVPGGVALDRFPPAERRHERPAILFSGVISERRKGVPVLLEALPLIAAAEPDVELWLSGPGDPDPWLAEAPAASLAHVHHLGLGEADRQHERYGRAWITCLPSMYDSFGMALVESLACGTPIVVTTHGAPRELVSEGVTGELCEPENPRSLADACLRALELARRPETVVSCRTSAERFDWDLGIAPLCEQLYLRSHS
jgi:glycosyltransferase involved in cell wall biosynthesis